MNHGNYILNENTYDNFLNMFNFILENFPENDKIIRNIISLSQTLYKIKEGKTNPKYYLLYSIYNNPIFNKIETWHKVINNSLSFINNNNDLTEDKEKKEKEKKLKEHAFNIIVENLSIMKLFMVNNEIYNEVKNYYINIYNLDDDNLKKEIKKFYKENEFSINKENENKLIMGDNKQVLINNINEIEMNYDENKDNIKKENNNNEIIENK